MSAEGLQQAIDKMQEAGVSQPAIRVFSDFYRQLEEGGTGLIREDDIEPLVDPPRLDAVEVTEQQMADAIGRTVFIKLNGGLGTSMGLDRAKSLLEVRDGLNFLDIAVKQVMSTRQQFGVELPLLLMDSFRTRADAMEVLGKYPELPVEGLPLDFLQNQEPKLRADDLTPVAWEADPSLEWCPPGHGDLYPALSGSGVLDALLAKGYRYASVSNGDNLGAAPDARIAAWFAASGAPYAAEVCERTVNDRKGGHLAVRKADGQLILRETAQTAPEEMAYFTDESRHRYFHTNNLWFDLQVLRDTLAERDSVLGLPLIRNEKTVDPSDKSSTPVVQVESAMGAAVEVFPGATAICVGRDRFLPVKTTNELMLLRSDVYDLGDDGRLVQKGARIPGVQLDGHYKLMGDFERLVPHSVGLREAESLTVEGPVTFGRDVRVVGEVALHVDEPTTLADGTELGAGSGIAGA